jgi:hypothetical protein
MIRRPTEDQFLDFSSLRRMDEIFLNGLDAIVSDDRQYLNYWRLLCLGFRIYLLVF